MEAKLKLILSAILPMVEGYDLNQNDISFLFSDENLPPPFLHFSKQS